MADLDELNAKLDAMSARLSFLEAKLAEADDTGVWLVTRTDELGEEKVSEKRTQGIVRAILPPKVERALVDGKVRRRIARSASVS